MTARTSLIVCLAMALPSAGGPPRPPVVFPLHVAADHRHLDDRAGRPFLVLGDTAWSLVAELSQSDIERYVDDRARRGFNAIVVNLIEHKFATRAPATREGIVPFLAPGDFARPNPAYFDLAHRAVAYAAGRGLSVWLCPAYLGWDGGDEGFFKEIKAAGPDALRTYGEFVGRRFRDLPNIVWMPGGDYALPPSERWAAEELVRGLRAGGAAQPITAHGGQTSAVDTFGDRDWLAIDTVYSYADDLRPPSLKAYERRPRRPYVLIESTYEGEHDARPDRIRRQAWTAMLSGAAGQFFGNNPMWHFDGPTLFPHAVDWRQALDSVGARDMTRLGATLGANPWWDLVPDAEGVLATTMPPGAPIVSARTADGRLAVVYVGASGPEPLELIVNLHGLGPHATAQWFNPARDEAPRPEPAVTTSRDGQRVRTPGANGAGSGDWVLVLRGSR